MNQTRHHTFDVGRAGSGSIDLLNGEIEFKHETVPAITNMHGLSVMHNYNNRRFVNSPAIPIYGLFWTIELSPAYDAKSDFYKYKVEVVFDQSNSEKINSIKDRLTNQEIMRFVYSTAAPVRLDKIVYQGNKEVKITYETSGRRLVKITYPNNECAYFQNEGADGDGELYRIVSPAKTGVQFEYRFGNITGIKDISYMKSVDANNIISGTIGGNPSDTDNEVKFEFVNVNNSNVNYKTTKTEVKTGRKFVYDFKISTGKVYPKDFETGLVREEMWLNNTLQSYATFSRTYVASTQKATETAIYNAGKEDETKVTSVYNYHAETTLHSQTINRSFNEIVDGQVSAKVDYTAAKVCTYVNEKLQEEHTTQTFKKGSAVSTKQSKTLYFYYNAPSMAHDKKLRAIEHAAELIAGAPKEYIVQEYFYDANGNVKQIEIYNGAETTVRVKQKFESDTYGRTTGAYNARNYKTEVHYAQGTNVIEKTVDPTQIKTSFDVDSALQTQAIRTTNEYNDLLANTSLSYNSSYLTALNGLGESIQFAYYGKDASGAYKTKQEISLQGTPYLETTYQETKEANGLLTVATAATAYASGEKVEVTAEASGRVTTAYTPLSGEKQTLLTQTLNPNKGLLLQSKDHLTNATTNYAYDVLGNLISCEDNQLKTAVTTTATGEFSGISHTLKELNKKQNYAYAESAQTTSLTLPTGKTETLQTQQVGKVLQLSAAAGEQSFHYGSGVLLGMHDSVCSTSCEHDSKGNLTKIFEKGMLAVEYTYNELNQLIYEDDYKNNRYYAYTYNLSGNIICKEQNQNPSMQASHLTRLSLVEYTYNDVLHMSSVGGEICEYDAVGNPVIYRGKPCTWSHVHNLASFRGVQFAYNANGLRTGKKRGSQEANYLYAGDKLLAERRTVQKQHYSIDLPVSLPIDSEDEYSYIAEVKQTTNIQYLYGINGITGFVVNDAVYYYRKNLFGDITHVYDVNGKLKAEYVYDAWGNHEVVVDVDGIGTLNPFRYRGYYYDAETGLYYLNSRYYDAEVGRFISMDSVEYIDPNIVHGLNLYAYGLNNPVKYVDKTGHYAVENAPNFWDTLGLFLEYVENTSLAIFAGMAKSAGRADLAGVLGKIAPAFSKVFGVAGIMMIGINTIGNIVTNIQNNVSPLRMVTDVAIDLGSGLGLIGVINWAGIKFGLLLGSPLLAGLVVGVGFAVLDHFFINPFIKDLKNFVGKTVNQLEKEVNKFFKLLKKLFT